MLLYCVLERYVMLGEVCGAAAREMFKQKLLDERRNQAILMAWTKKLLLDHDTSQHVGSFELICFMLQILSPAGWWSKEGIGVNIGERVIHRISAGDGDEDPDLKFDQRSLEVDLCHFFANHRPFAREMGSSKILPIDDLIWFTDILAMGHDRCKTTTKSCVYFLCIDFTRYDSLQ